MGGTAAGKSTGEVGVDASALAEDDSPNDAALRLGDEAAKRLSETLAQPVEWTGVTQIEPGKRSKKCRHAGDRGDERGGAPAQPARAICARDCQRREDKGQHQREPDPRERRHLDRERDQDRARCRGKKRRPKD